MRLFLTALIDFKDNQKSRRKSGNVPLNHNDDSQSLVNPRMLIEKLESNRGDPELDVDAYHKGLMSATLKFEDLSFRRHYFNWIYSRYSKSTTNRRRIQRNERMVLLDWAKQFNREHRHLKILTVGPNVGNHHFKARLKLIGFNRPFDQLSFDFRSALEAEYDQKYNQAFAQFEAMEGHRLARILEATFLQYIPDADFQFISRNPDQETVNKLKPVKFDPEWINQQQQKSAASTEAKFNRFQKMYNSALMSANSRSASDSNTIAKLNQQLRSASSERTSLIASKSQAVNNLHTRINALGSNKSLANQSIIKLKRSLMTQLSKTQSHVADYYSSAVKASSFAANASENAKALSSARSVQKRLRSKISSQSSDNHQLKSQVKTFSSNANAFRRASTKAKRSFTSQLSTAQSSMSRAFFSTESISASAVGLNHSLSSLSNKLSQTISLSSLNVATNAKIINDLKVQGASASTLTSNRSNNSETSEVADKSQAGVESSANYTSDYNYSSVKNRSFSTDRSLSFAQSVKVDKDFPSNSNRSEASVNSDVESNARQSPKPAGKWAVAKEPKGKWGIAKRHSYIPAVIIISIIIIILLIFIFPLFRF